MNKKWLICSQPVSKGDIACFLIVAISKLLFIIILINLNELRIFFSS
jgi:hypothetical protein